jgi:hypothetical protein
MCAETLLEYSSAKAVSMRLDTSRPMAWRSGRVIADADTGDRRNRRTAA